ncbi:MAG: formimidoylglutamate deiminase [Burkholderiales bacterium]|nr:formimidoylglutamate deiminase [Burkholderiales bacterium]
MPEAALLWAPLAWTPAGWREQVVLRAGSDGRWAEVTPGVAAPPPGAIVLAGPLLPGLVNAHSHAFQRAFAGHAERREAASDDFWSWRDRMYRVALRISPAQLRDVAAQLYVELLKGGYTQVCEFHYLQHDVDGQPYADPLEMSWALADAAAETGIGLTLLPVLYERAGFTTVLRSDQRRFRTSAEQVWRAAAEIGAIRRPGVSAGLAIHSLRAALPDSIAELRRRAEGFAGPIHIHVAEQTAEVDDCVKTTGARPIEWLAREGLLDARWQLVHATHTVPAEIEAVARSGAGVVLCPGTEANLGDGLADVPGWLAADVPLTIGSDSHVGRDWREELRWLEYGQRLALRQRNVAAAPESGQPSTAEHLFARSLAGSASAAGEPAWGLVPGARADALVVDPQEDALLGVAPRQTLDALLFSSPGRSWRDVLVAGRWVIRDRVHAHAAQIAQRFSATMHELG